MSNPSNRNTSFLLLLLFLAVLTTILIAHNHENKSSTNNSPSTPPPLPNDSNGATPPTSCNDDSPPPTSAAPPPNYSNPPPPPPLPTLVPDLVVAVDGTGNYTKIADAVTAAPNHSLKWFVISIKAGVYHENVKIIEDKTNIVLVGDGKNKTILTSDRCANRGWRTSYTATLVVMGDGFIAQDMTIENTAGPDGAQAVALRTESDRSVFYRCSIVGFQDTLYAKLNRQFYRDCDIYGTVDFIFGHAAAVFQNCNLYARRPLPNQTITFTAQGRNSTEVNNGFSIHNCTITATPELEEGKSSFQSYLGRPWKEYSRTVVMQSFLGDIIDPGGWLAWNQSFANTLNYGEYENRGPGANTTQRVRWPGYRIIDDSDEAKQFTVAQFIDGDEWLPSTNVPYSGGLI